MVGYPSGLIQLHTRHGVVSRIAGQPIGANQLDVQSPPMIRRDTEPGAHQPAEDFGGRVCQRTATGLFVRRMSLLCGSVSPYGTTSVMPRMLSYNVPHHEVRPRVRFGHVSSPGLAALRPHSRMVRPHGPFQDLPRRPVPSFAAAQHLTIVVCGVESEGGCWR